MTLRSFLLLLVTVVLSGATAWAHHSFGATYDINQQIRVEGRLVQFALRNPHSFVYIQSEAEDGEVQRWALEWGGAGALGRQGIERDTLRPGDEIVITANPSRVRGEYKALMLTLLRPSDGFSWGTAPEEVVD